MEKEDSKLFKHKADFITGILLIYHFVLNLTTKSFTLLHRDVFAYVLVCNSREKTWFRQLKITPLGYYNVHTRADVWPLCSTVDARVITISNMMRFSFSSILWWNLFCEKLDVFIAIQRSPSRDQDSQSPVPPYAAPTYPPPSVFTPSHQGGDRLSPGSLDVRLTAELNRLEYMEESVRQLTDVERTRAVSMAQQETVSLAQILKVSVWISFSLSVILLVIRDGDCFTFAYRAIFNLLSKVILTSLCDWSRKLAPSSQPIRCKTKNNHSLVTRVFPRFSQFDCSCFEFSLALKGVSPSDLPLWLLWFWYYDITEKISVYFDWSRKLKSLSHPIGCRLKLFLTWSSQSSRASSKLWWPIIVESLWLFQSIIFHFHVCWWYCCLFYC